MSVDSVVEGFERQVDADPERDAVRRPSLAAGGGASDARPSRGAKGAISFAQLDTWADAIASELIHRRGSRPEPVPLAVYAPELMLAAALGTLKAGKFYAAVNPLHPAPRVRRVLDELDAPLLLCDRRGEVAAHHGPPALSVEETVAARTSDGRPGLRFDDGRLAYVLYTSGSTGRPRGVAQSRRDMLHNVARHRPLAVGRGDCVTLISADGFVAAVSNPYVALLGGAALAPYSFKDAGAEGMLDWLRAVRVTVLYAFPSFLRLLAAAETVRVHDSLRLAYLGGETVLPADLAAARRLFPTATLSVGLNSSETGLTCLHLTPPDTALPDPVPAGRPVLDVEVAVLDRRRAPLPPGEPGEIEIRSEYVRPRYWGQGAAHDNGVPAPETYDVGAPAPAVHNDSAPATAAHDDSAPAPPFHTGDRGRIDADGIVYHLGRLDGMVKIRGFRVETAEVEAVISALPGVAEVAVFATGEDPAAAELAACVVGQGRDINPVVVRSAVASELPAAMIPARVLSVEALPRTPNGKLDRKRLTQLAGTPGAGVRVAPPARTATTAPAAVNGSGGSPGSNGSPAPEEDVRRASIERRIAAIWSVELGVEHVRADGDFFALGGTSIVAVSLVARVRRELGVPLPLALLFEAPTIAGFAAGVIELQGEAPGEPHESETPGERIEEQSATRASYPRLIRELLALQAPLRAMPLADRRRQYDRAERVLGADVAPGDVIDAGGCAAEWVLARRDPAQPVVVYLHGGGYSLGSPRSHRHLAASLGSAADAAVLSVDYRRAPEFPFPAAVDDTLAATRWLLGHTDGPVVLAGDSAGGGLVVASMIALRDAGLPLPVAGICLSPWVDLTCAAGALTTLAARDPLLSAAELQRMAASYLRDADPRHPLASPAFAELIGLPPLLIQVGTDEILLDDARTLASAASAAGVETTLQEWPGMIHVWQWYFPVLDEGRRAIAEIGAFIRRHTAGEDPHPESPALSTNGSRPSVRARKAPVSLVDRPRTVPASPIQEAHLQIVPSTTGRGYLSWVYQLNGRLDAHALARAIDDVVRRHEILRARFERRDGRMYLAVDPLAPGTLDLVDLSSHTKREALDAALDDVETLYGSLSPFEDPRFRATLYTIDHKTSVLAMFVAEALVDSDSGSLLAADIARAYAEHAGSPAPAELPEVSDASYLDHIASHPPDPAAVARAREHWARQARSAPPVSGWPSTARDRGAGNSTFTFKLTPAQWTQVTSHARELRITPYVFVLTCLQLALAHVGDVTHFLAHSIVSVRGATEQGMIGNFHSLGRIDLRLDPDADFKGAAARTAAVVAETVEHSALPATLTASGTPLALPSGDLLPSIRFYMFSNHEGPVFTGVRRRRFRMHQIAPAPLSFSCIHGPEGRQDFVLTSTTAPQARLDHLAMTIRRHLRGG
jgi:acetyl esterase/lipase/acyl-coenzyme A synthetase/AMP-(fatty) acid ligase